jgi:hypothetical protein
VDARILISQAQRHAQVAEHVAAEVTGIMMGEVEKD